MFKISGIRRYENLHILLWLLKDTCWVLLWKTGGMLMIVPTIAVAVHITWLRRKIKAELYHNLAVCLWISGNSIWMTGEFFYDDTFRGPALLLFTAGLISMVYYYVSEYYHPSGDEVKQENP